MERFYKQKLLDSRLRGNDSLIQQVFMSFLRKQESSTLKTNYHKESLNLGSK
jgi:hypothetical protein